MTFWNLQSSQIVPAGKTYLYRINRVKPKIYKQVLKEGHVNFGEAKDFINSKIKEICFRETLSINGDTGEFLDFLALRMVVETIINM